MIKELGRSLLNAKDDYGCTALMYAVWNANIKCVKILIAIGADVNLINDQPKVRHTTTDSEGSPSQLYRQNRSNSMDTSSTCRKCGRAEVFNRR